jgi:5-methyltetrahydrofolate--homocysteine methyltransferase
MEDSIDRLSYLDALKKKVLIFDGAMGTNLARMKLTAAHFGGDRLFGCNDCLVLTSPQAVEKVHRSFLEAGVDTIETNTFRANRITLDEYGIADQVQEINRSGAMLARRLADEFSTPDHPRFVAGSLGPTGQLLSSSDPNLCRFSFDEIADVYRQQAQSLLEGGIDLFLIETAQDILEVKAAILGIRSISTRTPIQVQVTLDSNGRMLMGTDISAVLAILEGMPIDVIGINCSTGPEQMRAPISILGEHSSLPVSCLPNAGIPLSQEGEAVYPLQPQEFADQLIEFVEKFKVNIVGGCCGTTPEHLRLLVQKLGDRPAPKHNPQKTSSLSSAMHALAMCQKPAPLIIGERLNTQGSKDFKQSVLAQNWDNALTIARQQMENGAHALDLCTVLTEKSNEAQTMQQMVKLLSAAIDAPLVIDSTDPAVIETALKSAPGRSLINSINLESGEEKATRVFTLALQFNAAVMCLTIDEKGLAKTAQRKLKIAQRIVQLATEQFHLQPSSLVFDPLTFSLASGDADSANAAGETLESIRLIKAELPGVFTSLGISNVSFGLSKAARGILNSIFLYHALQAGLDMAILNPAQIKPYPEIPVEEKKLAEDLILNRSSQALADFIAHFKLENNRPEHKETTVGKQHLPPEKKIAWHILNRVKQGLEDEIDKLIIPKSPATRNESALRILNQILLPAMQMVGEKFGSGELILPFVLQSAEVMKAAVDHLEQYLSRGQAASKGRVVLATVYGDVHDIGKNLVKTILANNGYEVIDLGKQVPAEQIIQAAIEQKADAIGLSALLVSTSQQMAQIAAELQRKNLTIPLLIGGAAINPEFAARIEVGENGKSYSGGVFYCKDAFDALAVLEKVTQKKSTENIQVNAGHNQNANLSINESKTVSGLTSRKLEKAAIPQPPFWGSRLLKPPLDEVLPFVNKKALYRLSWGAKNARGEKWDKLSQDFDLRFEKMTTDLKSTQWLDLLVLYGYWPAQSFGNSLIIYETGNIQNPHPQEIACFNFPRQSGDGGLCLADYFASADSGTMDVAAFQVVTVGKRAVEFVNHLYKTSDMSEAYFSHGLAVALTEALAEYTHTLIRRELGLSQKQGKRFSWGYPALPDLSQHAILFGFLPAKQELGMTLTSGFQMSPELSTAAILVHHPQAAYLSMR